MQNKVPSDRNISLQTSAPRVHSQNTALIKWLANCSRFFCHWLITLLTHTHYSNTTNHRQTSNIRVGSLQRKFLCPLKPFAASCQRKSTHRPRHVAQSSTEEPVNCDKLPTLTSCTWIQCTSFVTANEARKKQQTIVAKQPQNRQRAQTIIITFLRCFSGSSRCGFSYTEWIVFLTAIFSYD